MLLIFWGWIGLRTLTVVLSGLLPLALFAFSLLPFTLLLAGLLSVFTFSLLVAAVSVLGVLLIVLSDLITWFIASGFSLLIRIRRRAFFCILIGRTAQLAFTLAAVVIEESPVGRFLNFFADLVNRFGD